MWTVRNYSHLRPFHIRRPIRSRSVWRWRNGRSCGTRRRRRRRIGRGRDSYFHDFEPRERGDDGQPGGPANLSFLPLLLVAEHDADFQTDSVAVDIPELRKRLSGDVDGFLDMREVGRLSTTSLGDQCRRSGCQGRTS